MIGAKISPLQISFFLELFEPHKAAEGLVEVNDLLRSFEGDSLDARPNVSRELAQDAEKLLDFTHTPDLLAFEVKFFLQGVLNKILVEKRNTNWQSGVNVSLEAHRHCEVLFVPADLLFF